MTLQWLLCGVMRVPSPFPPPTTHHPPPTTTTTTHHPSPTTHHPSPPLSPLRRPRSFGQDKVSRYQNTHRPSHRNSICAFDQTFRNITVMRGHTHKPTDRQMAAIVAAIATGLLGTGACFSGGGSKLSIERQFQRTRRIRCNDVRQWTCDEYYLRPHCDILSSSRRCRPRASDLRHMRER